MAGDPTLRMACVESDLSASGRPGRVKRIWSTALVALLVIQTACLRSEDNRAPAIATIELPEAAFSSPTRVSIRATEDPSTAAEFDLTAQMFAVTLRARQELRINTGQVAPSKTLPVVANLPRDLAARMQESDEPKAFVQVFQDGGDEVLDSFEVIPSTYNPASKTLQFDLVPEMFTNRRTSDETWEAVMVVGASRKAHAAGPVVRAP